MATTQYIGARYVPRHMGEWDTNTQYGALDVVLYTDGNSYTAKCFPPKGTPPTNGQYWALSSKFNQQLAALDEKVSNMQKPLKIFSDSTNVQVDDVLYKNGFFYHISDDAEYPGTALSFPIGGLFANCIFNNVEPEMFRTGNETFSELLQKSIDSGFNVYVPTGDYTINSTVNINNKSGFCIDFGNSVVTCETDAFFISGSVENVNIKNGIFKTDNEVKCFYSVSNALNAFNGVNIENCVFDGFNVSISFNCDLAGYFKNCTVNDCEVKNTRGYDIGFGYGIHFACGVYVDGFSTVNNCKFENTTRHAVYIARGCNYKVNNCIFKNHIPKDTPRAALQISRSKNVTVCNCGFDKMKNAAISIVSDRNPEGYPESEYACENVNIFGCCFTGESAYWQVVVANNTNQETEYPENVSIENNCFDTLYSVIINAGKNVVFANNIVNGGKYCITVDGVSGCSDNYSIFANIVKCSDVPIRLNNGFCVNNINAYFLFNVLSTANNIASAAAAITNNLIRTTGAFTGVTIGTYGEFKINGKPI